MCLSARFSFANRGVVFNVTCNGTVIAPRPPSSGKLVSDDFQYFIGGMMPELASPVQQSLTVIEIRPFKGGWQCFLKGGAFNRIVPVTRRERTQSVTPLRAQNSGAERFGCSIKMGQLRR